MINGFNQKEINLDLKGFPLYRVTTGKNIFVKNFSSFNIKISKYHPSINPTSTLPHFLFLYPHKTCSNCKKHLISFLKQLFTYKSLLQKIKARVRYRQRRARKSSKRAQLWTFTPHFSKFRVFRTVHSTKRDVFLEFLVENKAFNFSKRALRANIARDKWLK